MVANDGQCAAAQFSVLDHAPIGQFVLREDFTVIFWNRCLETWTGIFREEICGKTILDYYPHLDTARYRSRITSIFAGSPPTIFSSQLHKYIIPAPLPGGKFRSQYTVVTGIPAQEAKGYYALFAIQDVTSLTEAIENQRVALRQAKEEMEERKKAEAELLRNAQELKKLNVILEERSIRDGLTGLFNHLHFFELLRRDFELAMRQGTDLACLLIDIDHFKQINDRYGHPFGDVVLKAIAVIMQDRVRKTDIVSRYGGEEFAMLFPSTGLDGALVIADEIRSSIENHAFHFGDLTVKATASIGVASISSHRPKSPDELVRYADNALYKAKANGRNRIEFEPCSNEKKRRA